MASKFTITAELNLQTKNLSQVVNNLKQQFQGADLNIKIKDLAKAEASLRNISSGAKDASASMGMLGGSINQAFRRFTVVTLATGTIVGFTRALKNAVSDAIEFERELVKIAQATGQSVAQLRGLATEVGNVSSSFGVSSKELILAARSLTQAGFAADKVTGSLKILAQTELAATFDSISNTTEGAIALLNQFGKQAQKTGSEVAFLEKSFSAINQVSKEFAVESSDLVTAVRTTGAAFEAAGGNLNELLALFTSVRSTTRESAESISTGFRTIFTRIQRVDTINNLKALGIQLQDVEGKFVGPMEATKRLSMALSTIDPRDFRFNLIVEELGGFRQVSKVIPLIQQFATTQKALNVAQGSSGSLAKDAQTAQLSLAVQISKTREEFLRFIRDLTETESFQGTVRTLLNMANAFIKVADTIKPLIPLLGAFAALRIGQSILPAIASVAGARGNKKAEGGVIHKFARGGLVPGQGNGDTVPAMLTPGEFVIKKSSVKQLGVDNLARVNKYANGGVISNFGNKAVTKTKILKGRTEIGLNKDEYYLANDIGHESLEIGKTKNTESQKGKNNYYIKSLEKGEKKESVATSQVKDLLKNNKKSADVWEELVQKVYGGTLQRKNGFPVDVTGTSGEFNLRDAKYKPDGSDTDADGIAKSLNYDLYTAFGTSGLSEPKYDYSKVNKLTFDRRKPITFLGKSITARKDTFRSPNTFTFSYPKFDLSTEDLKELKFGSIVAESNQEKQKQSKDKLKILQDEQQLLKSKNPKTDSQKKRLEQLGKSIKYYENYLKNIKQGSFSLLRQNDLYAPDKNITFDKEYLNTVSPYSSFKDEDTQNFTTGGFVKLYPAKPSPSRKSKYQGVEINEDMWDASFDVADPKAYDYFVRSIQGPDSQKPSLKKYAEKQGKTYEQLFNLLQTQNAQWFEDRVHDEIGGILAGGNNYYVDILDANKTVMGDVDVKDTKKRESSSEFAAKAYNHARWKFANKIGPDPKTLKELSISSVTTHPNDPIFKESLKQAAQNLTVNKPKAGTQEKLEAMGLSTPTTTQLGQVITGATFKDRATEYQGYRLANLTEKGEMPQTSAIATNKAAQNATGMLASVLYDKLIQDYKDEGEEKTKIDVGQVNKVSLLKASNLSPIFNAILGTGPKNKVGKYSILTEQQVKAIKDEFKARMGRIGFASGGAAEGTDTVPAMLTPGEYVINKKSAQAIGYGNLNRMNKVGKFANGGEVQYLNKGGVAGNNNSEFSDIFSKYNDDELHHIFVKTALLSPNFSDSLTQYRELNLLPKPDSSQRGNSLKTMIEGYGLSKLSDKQLEAKYKNQFEITDDIKNAFKYYDRGIVDLISSFKKEDKNKIGEMANVDLKKDKNFGKIEVHTGKNAISARYIGDENDRTGFITAVKAKGDDDFYRTKFSYATSGYGLKLYETLLSEVAKAGSWMAPDNADISNEAANLWKRYYTRSDVDKNLLSYSNWNNKTGKFKTTPAKDIEQLKSTWPSKKDTDWALQYKYRKLAASADDANIVRSKRNFGPSYEGQEAVISAFYETPTRLAVGGNVPGDGNQDTVPAMLTPGEYVINKKSAQAIGYGALNRMNKVGKFANGGPVQMFNDGTTGQGVVDPYSVFRPKAAPQAAKPEEVVDKVTNKFGDLSDQLLLFGPAITGVISQMGMFEKSTADLISATTLTFSTIQGVGGNLVQQGGKMFGVDETNEVFKKLNLGVTAYAASQAFAAYRVQSFGNIVETEGKKFASFVESLTNGPGTSQSQMTEALNEQFKAASQVQSRQSGFVKAAGVAGTVAGTLLGGAAGASSTLGIGAAPGAIAGGAAGGAAAEEIAAYAVYGMSLKKVTEQANALSSAMYSATESNREFQKFNQNIDKQSSEKIAEQSAKLAAAYKLQSDQLAKFNAKDLASASDAVKQQFQAVSEAAKLTAKNLQQAIGAQLQQAAKKSGNLIGLGYEPDIDKLLAPVFASIEKKVTAQYAEKKPRTDEEAKNFAVQKDAQIKLEQEEARKVLVEATKQQIEMTAAMALENNIRRELIGTMQKQLAMSAAIERTAYELDRVSKTVSHIDAVFSGSLTGLKSSYDPEAIKMQSPDEGRLNDALAPVRAMGSAGQDLANNIVNINKVMPNLEAKLLEFEKATQTTANGVFDAAGFVKNAFDIDVDSAVGKALVDIIKNTTTGNNQGTNAVTAASTQLSQPEVRKKIAEAFQKFGEEFKTQASGILENLAKAEQEGRVIAEKINESRQKQLELALQGVDAFSQYVDAISKARGRDLSLIEKNTIRSMRQYALGGAMGNNSAALGTRLNKIYSDLNKGGLSIEDSSRLNAQARNLTKALEGLANQSEKTADVLQEIDKVKKNRENLRELGREFGTGTAEDKSKMQQDMQAAMIVAQTGSYDSIPEEMRKGADAMLERFKDIPFFKQAQNRAIADTFQQAGNPLAAQMVMQETSAPEEMLIHELGNIFADQIAAQQRLSMVEAQRQYYLGQAQEKNTIAIDNMSTLLTKLITKFETQAKPVENAGAVPADAKGKLDPDNLTKLNETIKSYTDKAIEIDATIGRISGSLKNLADNLAQSNDRFNEAKAKADDAVSAEKLDKVESDRAMGMGAGSSTFKRDNSIEDEIKRRDEEEKAGNKAKTESTKSDVVQPPTTTSATEAIDEAKKKSQGGIIYRADGGSIFQPKGTDTVHAMLTPGEFVIKKSSVDKIGVDALSKINAGHYSIGGEVTQDTSGYTEDNERYYKNRVGVGEPTISGFEPFLQEADDYNRSKLQKQGSGLGLYNNKDKASRWESEARAGVNKRGQFALDNMLDSNYDQEKGNDYRITTAFNRSGIAKENENTLSAYDYKNGAAPEVATKSAEKSAAQLAEEIKQILDEKTPPEVKDSKKEKEIKKDIKTLQGENKNLNKEITVLDKSITTMMSDIEQVIKMLDSMGGFGGGMGGFGGGGMGGFGGFGGGGGSMGGFGGGGMGGMGRAFGMLTGAGMGMGMGMGMGSGRTSNRRVRAQRRLATIKKIQEKAMPAMIQRKETEFKDKAQKAGQLETRGPASWNNPDQFDNNGVPLFNKTPLEPIELKSARDEAKGTGSPDFVGPPTKSEAFQAKLKADNAAYDKKTAEKRAKAQVMIDAQTKKDEERVKLGQQKVQEARVAADKTPAQRAADRSKAQEEKAQKPDLNSVTAARGPASYGSNSNPIIGSEPRKTDALKFTPKPIQTNTAAATKPKQSPYFFTSKPTKVRPANSMYTQEQWDEMARTGSNKPTKTQTQPKPKTEARPTGPMITRGVMAGKYPYSDGTYRTQPDQPTYQSPEQEMGNRAYNAPDPKTMSTAAYIKALQDRQKADVARGGGPTVSNMLREGQERREAQRQEALDPNNAVATSIREGEAKRKKQRQEARSPDSDAAKMIADGLKRQEENRRAAMQDAGTSTGPPSQINKLVQDQKKANPNYGKPLPEQKTQTDRLVEEQQQANPNYNKPLPERPNQQGLLALSRKKYIEKLKKEQEESKRVASLREPLVPRIPSRVDKDGKPLPKPYTPPMVEPITPPLSPFVPTPPKAKATKPSQDALFQYMTGASSTPPSGQVPLPEFARPPSPTPTLPKKKAAPKPFAWPGMGRDENVPRNKPTSGWPDMRRDESVPRVKPSALYPDLVKDPNVPFPKPLDRMPMPGQSGADSEQSASYEEQRKALEAKIEAKKKEIYEAQGGAMRPLGNLNDHPERIVMLDELTALEKQKDDLMGGTASDKAWRNRKNLYGDPDKSVPFPQPIPTMARPLPGETLPESMDRYNARTQRDAIAKQIYDMTGGDKGNKGEYVSPEDDMMTEALLDKHKKLTEPNFRANGGVIYRADGGLAGFRSNIKKNMNVRQQLQQNNNAPSNPNKQSNIFETGAMAVINTAKFATGMGLSDEDKLVKEAANKGELQNQQNATGFGENALEYVRGVGAAGGDAVMGLPEAAANITDRVVKNTVGGNLGAGDAVGSLKDALFINGDSLKSDASQYGKLSGDVVFGALSSLTGQPPSQKLLSFIKSKGPELLTGAAGTILKESEDFNNLPPAAQFAILQALGKAGKGKNPEAPKLTGNILDKAKQTATSTVKSIPDKAKEFVGDIGNIEKVDALGQKTEDFLTSKPKEEKDSTIGSLANAFNKGGLVSYFANGGMPKGTDTVHAMLTPGEFVMKKSAVDKHGQDFMEALNAGGEIKGFARGGAIGDNSGMFKNAMVNASQQSGPGSFTDLKDKMLERQKASNPGGMLKNAVVDARNQYGRGPLSDVTDKAFGLIPKPATREPAPDLSNSNNLLPKELQSQPVAPPVDVDVSKTPKKKTFEDTIRTTVANNRARREGNPEFGMNTAQIRNKQLSDPRAQQRMAFAARGRAAFANSPQGMAIQQSMNSARGQIQDSINNTRGQMQGSINNTYAQMGMGPAAGMGGGGGGAAQQGGGGGGQPGGMPNMSEVTTALNNMSTAFTGFTDKLNALATAFSGLTITHNIVFGGQINVGGVNGPEIVAALQGYVEKVVSAAIAAAPAKPVVQTGGISKTASPPG